MSDLSDPDYIAKLIRASGVANPRVVVIYQGFFYADSRGFVDTAPIPPTKVTVDPPKPAAKKPKNRTPRTRRLKNPAILKNGTILLKDREPERP